MKLVKDKEDRYSRVKIADNNIILKVEKENLSAMKSLKHLEVLKKIIFTNE